MNLSRSRKMVWPFLLLLPGLAYISMDKGLWHNDDCIYGRAAVTLWRNLLNHPLHWPFAIITTHSSRPPLMYFAGEFFVPVGRFFGSVDTGLLLCIFILSVMTLALLWETLERSYQNRLIALTGCLMMASAPLFMAQSRMFMAEIPQTLVVTWFIYLMVSARRHDRISLGLKLVAAVCAALLLKVATLLFCIAPAIVIASRLGGERGAPFVKWDRSKHGYLSAAAVILVMYTLGWYIKHAPVEMRYVQHQYSDHGSLPLFPFFEGVAYWMSAVQSAFFLWPLLVVIAAIAGYAVFWGRNKDLGPDVPVAVWVSVFQILSFIVAMAASPIDIQRYMLPLLPYFVVLVCHCLARINKATVTVLAATAFLIQLSVLYCFSFGFFFHQGPSTRLYQTVGPFKVTRSLEQVHLDDKGMRRVLGRIMALDKGPLVFDMDIKKASLMYYGACKAFPGIFHWDVHSFYELRAQGIDTEDLWDKLLGARPAYYITSDGYDPRLLAKVEESGLFEELPLADRAFLRVYRYKGNITD